MRDQLVPIDRAGRVVLPKNIREELAIKAGDMLKLSVQGTSIRMVVNERKLPGFQRKGKALVFTSGAEEILDPEAVENILSQTREERDSRGGGDGFRKKTTV